MPNNPFRFRRGYNPTLTGQKYAKRKDVFMSLNVVNRGFKSASQELGSPSGGPSPIFTGGSGGTTTPGGDYNNQL